MEVPTCHDEFYLIIDSPTVADKDKTCRRDKEFAGVVFRQG